MSERYQRLFSLPHNLYSMGAPVVIEAGALLKDGQTGKVLAQLKIKSISPKTIKAATVKIAQMDTVGNPLGKTVEHQYLDLTICQGQPFGAKEAVALPESATREFAVSVTRVIYTDNTTWDTDGTVWEALPAFGSIGDWLKDHRLAEQFRVEHGTCYQYAYGVAKDLWACPCGALNRLGERCSCCKAEAELFSALDKKTLLERYEKRIDEEEAAAKARADVERVRTRKMKRTATIATGVVLAVALAAFVVTQVIIPQSDYNAAVTLRESENYEGAIAAFTELGGFRDSRKQVLATYYAKGEKLLADNCREEAMVAFANANGYEDAADRAAGIPYMEVSDLIDAEDISKAMAQYNLLRKGKPAPESANKLIYAKAMALYDSGDYINAEKIFGQMGPYMDSADLRADSAYNVAQELAQDGEYDKAISLLSKATDQRSTILADEYRYIDGKNDYIKGDYLSAVKKLEEISDTSKYEDLDSMMELCIAYRTMYSAATPPDLSGYITMFNQDDVAKFEELCASYKSFVALAQERGIEMDDTHWNGALRNISKVIPIVRQGVSWYGKYIGEYSEGGQATLEVNVNSIYGDTDKEVVSLLFYSTSFSDMAVFCDGQLSCQGWGGTVYRLMDTTIIRGAEKTWTHIQ